MKVKENCQKDVFSSVPFKKFELSNPPIYSYTENWVQHKYFLCLFGEFSKFVYVHGMFWKVALLEISRTPLLTRVAGLQYTFCIATKYKLLTKEGLPGIRTSALKKEFLMDILLHKKLQKAKINTSKGNINFLKCHSWRQYWCWYLGTKIQVQKIEYEHYPKNILKLLNSIHIWFDFKSRPRRWRAAWCFQIFIMATHLFHFIHNIL